MKRRELIIIMLSLSLTTCIDPFDIGDVVDGEPLLVVDGLLTDQPKAHEVRISYSSPTLNTFEREAVRGAEVFIEDENGNQVQLIESFEPEGLYTTPSDFAGTVGLAYTLRIRTAENISYRSLPELMQPVAEIDSIYGELESRQSLSSIGVILDNWGMQFYVSTGTGLPESNFYQWNWEETYQFTAPLVREMQLIQPICYLTNRQFNQLLVGSSQDFARDRIERQPLTFVSKREYKLQRRYSLLVEQLSLSERAFNFWNDVEEQRNVDGSLFDPPPSQIIGNIVSDDDAEEIALGYFQVSAVTQKRFFITRGEVPTDPGGPVRGFSTCRETPEPTPDGGGGGDSPDGPATGPPEFCYNCTLIRGTTTERPSFW